MNKNTKTSKKLFIQKAEADKKHWITVNDFAGIIAGKEATIEAKIGRVNAKLISYIFLGN